MTDEIIKSDNAEDGGKVTDSVTDTVTDTRTDNEPKEPKENKPRTVSFNRDVHIKRFGESICRYIGLTSVTFLVQTCSSAPRL